MRLLSEKLNGRDPHEAGLALLQKLYALAGNQTHTPGQALF